MEYIAIFVNTSWYIWCSVMLDRHFLSRVNFSSGLILDLHFKKLVLTTNDVMQQLFLHPQFKSPLAAHVVAADPFVTRFEKRGDLERKFIFFQLRYVAEKTLRLGREASRMVR